MDKTLEKYEIESHECKENVEATVFRRKYANGKIGHWLIVIEDRGDRCRINFCPFCGEKLERS